MEVSKVSISLPLIMYKSYKYRIYPNEIQKQLIEQTFDACRLVYNLGLEIKIHAFKQHGIKISSFDLCYQLRGLRLEYDWIRQVDSQALQASVKKIDVAFKNFYNGYGYPKFKKKNNDQSFQCPNNKREVDFKKGLLTIPKMQNIQIRITREFTGKIKTITISRTSTNKYFASILVDNGMEFPQKHPIIESEAIGIDLGIKNFAILSDGVSFDNPKFLTTNLKRLKVICRRANRKKNGGANRKKEIKKLSVLYEKVANQRKDFLHKLSSKIVNDSQVTTIFTEGLMVKNMLKNNKISLVISDAGWGEFVRQLKYKCEWSGKNIIQIGRFEASTKTCSNCGAKNETLTLKDREWTCASCLVTHDRDVNAAINIKQMGLKKSGWGTSVEPVELSAIVEAVKQEEISCQSQSTLSKKNKK